mgnify:CR=1 FL=1
MSKSTYLLYLLNLNIIILCKERETRNLLIFLSYLTIRKKSTPLIVVSFTVFL